MFDIGPKFCTGVFLTGPEASLTSHAGLRKRDYETMNIAFGLRRARIDTVPSGFYDAGSGSSHALGEVFFTSYAYILYQVVSAIYMPTYFPLNSFCALFIKNSIGAY